MINKIFYHYKKDKYLYSIILLSLCYTIIFSILSYLRYSTLNSGWAFDLGLHNNWLWNTINGNFLYSQLNPPSFAFGHHAFFILLLILPFYSLFGNIIGVFVFISMSMGLGGVLLYLIAKEKLDNTIAMTISITYLANPIIHGLNIEDFRPEILAIPLIFLVFYFFQKRRFSWFLISMFVLMFVKENLSFVVAFLGIYGFFKGRRVKWVITPLVIGIIYFWLISSLLIPHHNPAGYHFIGAYKAYGETIPEILMNIAVNPEIITEKIHVGEKFNSFKPIFFGYSIISLLSPETLIIATPNIVKNFLLNERYIPFNQNNHYFSALIGIVFIATVYSTRKIVLILKRIKVNEKAIVYTLIIVIICSQLFSTFIYSPKLTNIYDGRTYKPSADYWQIKELMILIPDNASVSADNTLTAVLSQRKHIYSFNKNTIKDKESDYLLINKKGKNQQEWANNYQANLRKIANNTHKLVGQEKEWMILKKISSFEKDSSSAVSNQP